MSFFLLIIGLVLYFAGRIDLGGIRAEGRPVKAAGLVLIAPGLVSFLLATLFVPLAFGRNNAAIASALGFVDLLDLVASVVAVGIAYLLIVNPPNMPRLPGILGEIQGESTGLSGGGQSSGQSESSPRPTTPQQRQQTVTIPTPGQSNNPRPSLNRDRFPAVMGLKDAARYLQTTEDEILKLIDEGKLVAARDNYNYQIAKSQLDELL